MKYQVSPPRATATAAVFRASDHRSNVQWTVLGEHSLPVKLSWPPPETRKTASLSRTAKFTASAAAEFGTSTIALTFSESHLRVTAEATSALFWWSAEMTSILKGN